MTNDNKEHNEHISTVKQTEVKADDEKGIELLGKFIKPIVEEFTDLERDKLKMQIDFKLKVLGAEQKQNKYVITGLLIIAGLVLILSGVLFVTGRDETAKDLIIIVSLITTSLMAGYGLAKSKMTIESDDK